MKFELGQTIYYLIDNRLHSAPVETRMQVENAHDDWAHTDEQKNAWQHFGESGVFYVTCHGPIVEERCFASKAELAESL